MDRKQFIARLKHIYNNTKRQPGDSSLNDLRDAFLQEVIAKSNGEWDEAVAVQIIGFVEHLFKVQPEATQGAKSVSSEDAEVMLANFLQDRGYKYIHIPESREQSPDGYIENSGDKYICELKSPVLMFDHSQAPFGYKHSTTHAKILNAIHDGKKQLEKLDPEHALPHVLIYTSAHPQLNYTNFCNAIRGCIAMQDGTIMTDLRNRKIYQNTKDIIKDIDLYIWLQIGGGRFHQAIYFYNNTSIHNNSILKLMSGLEREATQNGSASRSLQDILGAAF